MSWYLFQNSPERQYRGKKVDGYQNIQKTKVVLDWGLGQLSPKKHPQVISKTVQKKPQRASKSQHQTTHINIQNIEKAKAIEQRVRILTQSSDEQGKEQLMRVLKKYQKKNESKDQEFNPYNMHQSSQAYALPAQKSYNNNSNNVLNTFEFEASNRSAHISRGKPQIDLQTAKRMRFLQNSLLPDNKRDNMSAILDFDLNEKVGESRMSDSRMSGKSHFGNKKNQSAVKLGDGFNSFVPMREKVRDMNQKLKEMYDYDEWCKKRQTSQFKLG